VLFFECDPVMALRCQANAMAHSQRCVNSCLSNVSGTTTFNKANNDGMSSSLRTLGEHGDLYPDVELASAITVSTTRYDEWKTGIPKGLLPDMNVLVVDVQGMDYEVLQGLGVELEGFEVLLVEVSSVELYAGQRMAHEVDALVASLGFVCVDSCAPCDHCDRLYRKGISAADRWQAKVARTFPCGLDAFFTARLPGNRGNREVKIPLALRDIADWQAFLALSTPMLHDLCTSTSATMLRSHGTTAAGSAASVAVEEAETAEAVAAEIGACIAELQDNINGFIIDECNAAKDA